MALLALLFVMLLSSLTLADTEANPIDTPSPQTQAPTKAEYFAGPGFHFGRSGLTNDAIQIVSQYVDKTGELDISVHQVASIIVVPSPWRCHCTP